MKKIIVFTEPHVADPAYQVPVLDFTDKNDQKMFTNEKYLLDLALEVRDQITRRRVIHETTKEVLSKLGVSYDDYIHLLRGTKKIDVKIRTQWAKRPVKK